MEQPHPRPAPDRPLVVGCLSSAEDLAGLEPALAQSACDLVEIRLDGLHAGGSATGTVLWGHLAPLPLMFTARRGDEGGTGDLDPETRAQLLRAALVDADWVDIEAASLGELGPVATTALENGIGLVVSFHDFNSVPDEDTLNDVIRTARDAGATVAKIAATPASPSELARLAGFTARDHGIAVSTMGMGPLAIASRLLCAQCGSVLNYGFLGSGPTAPGQWSAARLRDAISTLPQLRDS